MILPFSEVFQLDRDGSISPKVPVVVNGKTVNPGEAMSHDVPLGGVDVYSIQKRDLDLEVEKTDGVVKVVGSFEII